MREMLEIDSVQHIHYFDQENVCVCVLVCVCVHVCVTTHILMGS